MAASGNEQLRKKQDAAAPIHTQGTLQQEKQKQVFQTRQEEKKQQKSAAPKQEEKKQEQLLYGLPRQLNEDLIKDGIRRIGMAPEETLPSGNAPPEQKSFPVRSTLARSMEFPEDDKP